MAVAGYQTEDSIPRERLQYTTYFTSMVLSVYDNILGPTILKIWLGKTGETDTGGKLIMSAHLIKNMFNLMFYTS